MDERDWDRKRSSLMNSFESIPIIDCHTHVYDINVIGGLMDSMKTCNIDTLNILSIPAYGEDYMAQNIQCMLFKAMYPSKIYSYGGLHYPLQGTLKNKSDFLGQIKRLMQLGFDGIKMIEGKPNVRKRIDEPLDSPIYDDYFAYLEAEKIPLLYHVADPAGLWDKDKVPAYAIKEGWFYGDGTYVTKKILYEEVDGILKKFPRLNTIFAHFYFIPEEGIDRAGEFLDKWPGISYDLTPGSKMYGDFSKNPDRWRDFFIKYQDRILFGTDSGFSASTDLINTIRLFLETDNAYQSWGMNIRGICLDKKVLEKIYFKNFIRYTGKEPKKINFELAIDECSRVIEMAKSSPIKDKILPPMHQVMDKIQLLKNFFTQNNF